MEKSGCRCIDIWGDGQCTDHYLADLVKVTIARRTELPGSDKFWRAIQ